MIKLVLQLLAALLELAPKAIEAARAWKAGTDKSAKDKRNDDAIAEAQKAIDKPKP